VRAAVVWQAGAGFEVLDDVERRDPGPGEVVVRIRAAGVCQTDLSLAKGAFGQAMPVVLGHEGAGEVVEVGAAVTWPQAGDRVLLTWVPACQRCYMCVRGQTALCLERKRAGEIDTSGPPDLSVGGRPLVQGMGTATFAEEAVVSARSLLPLPDDVPFELAAILGCAVPTGFGAAALAAHVTPGETVLVVGAGAVGLSAVQGAVIAGASHVVVVDPQESRRTVAAGLGATAACAPGDDPRSCLPHPLGFDVAIDAVARSTTIRVAWDATRRGGRIVVVGAGQADDQVVFTAQELFHDEKKLIGSFYGSGAMRQEAPRLIELWRTGRLDLGRLVDAVVPLERIGEAVARQVAGAAVRVMVAP
jgi:S-(hydroxymethyl)glutathione dehydrogenase / alcohol dehydrogenase